MNFLIAVHLLSFIVYSVQTNPQEFNVTLLLEGREVSFDHILQNGQYKQIATVLIQVPGHSFVLEFDRLPVVISPDFRHTSIDEHGVEVELPHSFEESAIYKASSEGDSPIRGLFSVSGASLRGSLQDNFVMYHFVHKDGKNLVDGPHSSQENKPVIIAVKPEDGPQQNPIDHNVISLARSISQKRVIRVAIYYSSKFDTEIKATGTTVSQLSQLMTARARELYAPINYDLTISKLTMISESFANSPSSSTLLSDFRGYWQKLPSFSGDWGLLCVGGDVDGYSGKAYVGTMCNNPKSAVGVIDRGSTSGANIYRFGHIFAHELGHSLGADDDYDRVSKCCPSELCVMSNALPYKTNIIWSDCTKSEVNEYMVNQKGRACLPTSGGGSSTGSSSTGSSSSSSGPSSGTSSGSRRCTLANWMACSGLSCLSASSGKWYECEIIQVSGTKIKIHWVGYASSYDEWWDSNTAQSKIRGFSQKSQEVLEVPIVNPRCKTFTPLLLESIQETDKQRAPPSPSITLGGPHTVGIQFSIPLPIETKSSKTFLSFSPVSGEEGEDQKLNLRIWGERSSASSSLMRGSLISQRDRTSAFVDWDIVVPSSSVKKLVTPDLSTLVDSIVQLPHWKYDNPMTFIIEDRNQGGNITCKISADVGLEFEYCDLKPATTKVLLNAYVGAQLDCVLDFEWVPCKIIEYTPQKFLIKVQFMDKSALEQEIHLLNEAKMLSNPANLVEQVPLQWGSQGTLFASQPQAHDFVAVDVEDQPTPSNSNVGLIAFVIVVVAVALVVVVVVVVVRARLNKGRYGDRV